MEDFAKINPFSQQEYIVTYGGKEYRVENPVNDLAVWRKKLAQEGENPQESTIDVIDQLKLIVKDMQKKTSTTTTTQTPATSIATQDKPMPVFEIGVLLAVLAIVCFSTSGKTGTQQKTDNEQNSKEAKPLWIVREEMEAAGIEWGPTANKNHKPSYKPS